MLVVDTLSQPCLASVTCESRMALPYDHSAALGRHPVSQPGMPEQNEAARIGAQRSTGHTDTSAGARSLRVKIRAGKPQDASPSVPTHWHSLVILPVLPVLPAGERQGYRQ